MTNPPCLLFCVCRPHHNDTMEDFFVNFVGALIFSVIGFFYTKHKGRGKFASQFIPVVKPGPAASVHEEMS